MSEIYVSTDVEADGPVPGMHSMLSLGSAAYLADKTLISTFSVNLELLPGATADPETMAWWSKHPEAWETCRRDLRSPSDAMADYAAWLDQLPGKPVFAAYPAGFDFMFVCWYLMRFAGRNPFGFAALDIKTMAMVMLGRDYHDSTKDKMPRHWFDNLPHTHIALNDAIEQGFCSATCLQSRALAKSREPLEG